MELPLPSPEALAHSATLVSHIKDRIRKEGGWIPFALYMELALYAPGLGYYTAGSLKLGPEGDFTTAPELTPLFGQCLAQQVRECIDRGLTDILEVGAGSGALAAATLEELDRLDALPQRYFILELSPELRARERDTLARRVPQFLERVVWLNRLPPAFQGVVIGNEVLDAMPVEIIRRRAGAYAQGGVNGALEWEFRDAEAELLSTAKTLELPDDYLSEVPLIGRAFIKSVLQILERGVLIFIDYGFPAREFYHPQRNSGTLMCHYRHRAHDNPFFLPGLQDITAHVDFSSVAHTALEVGAEVLGYSTQAQFLINCGITDLMMRIPPDDAARYLPLASAAHKLLSPAEMGELFKVIAIGKEIEGPLRGFKAGDRKETL